MHLSIFYALIAVFFSVGNSDTALKYDVIRNGSVIGYLNATQSFSGEQVDYITESNVSVRILFTISMYSKVTGSFKNGILVNGMALRKVNGREKVNTVIRWEKDAYLLKEDDEQSLIKEKIYYTTACLFNKEPVGIGRIFSENFGKFITLKEVRPHYYELHLPDGNKNYYSYANGVCIGAEVNTNLTKAFFKLKK